MEKSLEGEWKNRLKFIACILLVILIGILNNIKLLSCFAIASALILSYLAIKRVIGFKAVFSVFFIALMLSVVQIFSAGSKVLVDTSFLGIGICIYSEGVHRGILIFLKVWGSLGMVSALMSTVGINELVEVLGWLKVPEAFGEVIVFAVKYIYILKDEAFSVMKAQRSRLGYKGFFRSVASMSSVAGIVLSRAYDRSKTLSKSMKSRGYSGVTLHTGKRT